MRWIADIGLAPNTMRTIATVRRRQFIACLICTTVWPTAASAQQSTPVIGWLSNQSAASDAEGLAAFRQGLRDGGFVEGSNVVVEYRWAEDHNDRLRRMADELVARPVTVIVAAGGTPAALAAKEATATIPIVFQVSSDPVRAGLVTSLNRPDGNVTGIAGFTDVMLAKRLELLTEVTPGAVVFGLLLNQNNPNSQSRKTDLIAAARQLGREMRAFEVRELNDLEGTLAKAVAAGAGGLVVQNDTLFISHKDQLALLATRFRLPTIYEERENVQAGGLMSYGASRKERLRALGIYTSRVLKGERPSALPIDQPTTFELVINLKTRTIGITVPPALLTRADEVIE
jgi:putative tryptophan/tyrosine transport system substrate-binding protein